MSYHTYLNEPLQATLDKLNRHELGSHTYLKPIGCRGFAQVIVVGAGGVGARVVRDLVKVMPHDPTARVYIIDDDIVSDRNIARQAFHPNDVGKPKALVLAERYDKTDRGKVVRCHGMQAKVEQVFTPENADFYPHITSNYENLMVIGCVDNIETRAFLLNTLRNLFKNNPYRDGAIPQQTKKICYIDCGSDGTSGQVVFAFGRWPSTSEVYQTVPVYVEGWHAFPQLFDTNSDLAIQQRVTNRPNCGETVDTQTATSNALVANTAVTLYQRLTNDQTIHSLGYRLNAAALSTEPIPLRHTLTWGYNGRGQPLPLFTAVPLTTPDHAISGSIFNFALTPSGPEMTSKDELDILLCGVPYSNTPSYVNGAGRFDDDFVWDYRFWVAKQTA